MVLRLHTASALWSRVLGVVIILAAGQAACASDLTDAMDRTGLKYQLQTDGAVALGVQGQQLHTVVVRRLESHTVAYCLLARPATPGQQPAMPALLHVDRSAPVGLWRTLAELNANPWLPRISCVESHIVVSVPLPNAVATPELLRDGIMAVGTVADLALPRVLQALAAE